MASSAASTLRPERLCGKRTSARARQKQYFFHGDVFIAPDRIVASADVDTKTGAEAGVHAFDRETGRQLWKYPAGRGVPGAVVGANDRVFAYTASGELIALSLASGKREWTYALNAGAWGKSRRHWRSGARGLERRLGLCVR
jgi:outer membrane protein assembly factor BamB